MMISVPFIIAIVSIARESIPWSIVYLLGFIGAQILIMRLCCTHCPHYCKNSKKLRCLFLWNVSKIFKPRPGHWKLVDKIGIPMTIIILIIFPIYWLYKSKLLFALYVISGVNFMVSLRRYECPRCIYFQCPLNRVHEDVRDEFNNNTLK